MVRPDGGEGLERKGVRVCCGHHGGLAAAVLREHSERAGTACGQYGRLFDRALVVGSLWGQSFFYVHAQYCALLSSPVPPASFAYRVPCGKGGTLLWCVQRGAKRLKGELRLRCAVDGGLCLAKGHRGLRVELRGRRDLEPPAGIALHGGLEEGVGAVGERGRRMKRRRGREKKGIVRERKRVK